MPGLRRIARILLVVTLAALVAAPGWCSDQARYAGLTIVYTNDIHGHLFPFDYDRLGEQEREAGGAARRATLIRQIRESSSNPVLVMDAGDVFTRGPLSHLKGVVDFEVMNAIRYDVMALGNNEFKGAPGSEGLQNLFDRVRQAKFPIVSANVFDQATGKTIVPAYVVFEFGALKVGVFGLTAQRTAAYDQARGLEVRDPVSTARRVAAELEGKCNFIIALTHVGYPTDLEIAREVPQIDVIIGGDSHTWLFEPTLVRVKDSNRPSWAVGGIPVCQAGEWGKAVGKLDLSLRHDDNGRFRIMGYSGRLINVDSSIKPAEDIDRIVRRYAKPYLREAGRLQKAVSKPEAPSWVAQRLLDATGADIAVEPISSVENGLPAGGVTYLDIRKMFPFVNGVVVVEATGGQIAEFIRQTEAGIAGARLEDGKLYTGSVPADENAVYKLAIEDYYAETHPALADAPRSRTGRTTLEIVTDFIRSQTK